jgi:hypothetical protein
MEIDMTSGRFVEGLPVGRNTVIKNIVAHEKELSVADGIAYDQKIFDSRIKELEEAIPKIKGLYVVEGGELKFQKVF